MFFDSKVEEKKIKIYLEIKRRGGKTYADDHMLSKKLFFQNIIFFFFDKYFFSTL